MSLSRAAVALALHMDGRGSRKEKGKYLYG
jgi:hypothetical protein